MGFSLLSIEQGGPKKSNPPHPVLYSFCLLLLTDANMKKFLEIPIRPVRIAFDHWELRDVYENTVRTAVRNRHRNFSNYILYNFEDPI